MIRRVCIGLYRRSVRAFPPEHRARYGAEMVDAFARRWDDLTERRGPVSGVPFALAATADTLVSGWAARRASRDVGTGWAGVAADLRHAVRSLARSWSFSLVCLLSLAGGFGVALAVQLLFDVTLDPPFGVDRQGLVEVLAQRPGQIGETWAYPDFAEVRTGVPELNTAGWAPGDAVLRPDAGEHTEPASATYVTTNYFEVLGMAPALGRVFGPADDVPSDAVPVILGHQVWTSRLGSDPGVIGRRVTVNRRAHVVVGVMPRHFRHHHVGRVTDLWVPLATHPRLADDGDGAFEQEAEWVRILGRHDPSVTLPRVAASVQGVLAGSAETRPSPDGVATARVLPWAWQGAQVGGDAWILRGIFTLICGALLLVVCLNLSGMILVRNASRERELALRLALGAGRRRIVRFLMAEAVVLAAVGSVLALATCIVTLEALSWHFSTPLPASLRIDWPFLALFAATAGGAAVAFGLLPALRFSRSDLLGSLKDDAGGGRRRAGRAHRFAASAQAGIAVPILVVAGGVAYGAFAMGNADFGVVSDGLLVSTPVDVRPSGYDAEEAAVLGARLAADLRGLPGVAGAAVADGVPLDGTQRYRVVVTPADVQTVAQVTRVGEGYLDVLGVELLRGRALTDGDAAGTPRVAVVTKELASTLFPDGDPLGQRIAFGDGGPEAGPEADGASTRAWLTIVGVTADLAGPVLESPPIHVFVPWRQDPGTALALAVRSGLPPDELARAVQEAVTRLDDGLPRMTLAPFQRRVEDASGDLGTWRAFFAVVGGLLLFLSAMGIYGIVAFAVARRTREIGVRMSLGSSRERVLGSVVGDAVRLAVPGLLLGTLAGFAVARLILEGMYLHLGITLGGPWILVGSAALAGAVVVVASLLPARRAAGIDPMEALRAE